MDQHSSWVVLALRCEEKVLFSPWLHTESAGLLQIPKFLFGSSQAAVPIAWEGRCSAWLGTPAQGSAAEPGLAELREVLGSTRH